MLKKQLCILILSISLVIQPLKCNSEKIMQEIKTAGFYTVTGFIAYQSLYYTYKSLLTHLIPPQNSEEKRRNDFYINIFTPISMDKLSNTSIPNHFHKTVFYYGNNIINSLQTIIASIIDGIKSPRFFSQKTPKKIMIATAYCSIGVLSSMLLDYANNYRQTTRFNGFLSDQTWHISSNIGYTLTLSALTKQLLSEKQQKNNKLVNTLYAVGAVGGIGQQLTCAYLVQKNLTKQT